MEVSLENGQKDILRAIFPHILRKKNEKDTKKQIIVYVCISYIKKQYIVLYRYMTHLNVKLNT